MPIRQGRKVTELTALNSASLNTYVVGVDNDITYKISLDVLEDAVVKIVSSSTDARLDAIEAYTASFSASTNISELNQFTSSTDSRLDSIESTTSSINTTLTVHTSNIQNLILKDEILDSQTYNLEQFSSSVLNNFIQEDETTPAENQFVPYFTSDNKIGKSPIYVTGSRVIIGGASASIHPFVPEAFAVYSQLDGYNCISGHGTTNNYLQLNIKNFSTLSNASSDVVATADNGTEDSFYVNMGINGSGYDEDTIIGTANDAYVYGYGNVFHIGNAAEEPVIIFAGGFDARGEHLKMVIDPFDNHTMTGSLEINGRLNVLGGLTGSIDYSNLTNIPTLISSSTQISESGFVSSSTINNIETITSASYAAITPVSGTLYIIID